jgi:hypothetical protein
MIGFPPLPHAHELLRRGYVNEGVPVEQQEVRALPGSSKKDRRRPCHSDLVARVA